MLPKKTRIPRRIFADLLEKSRYSNSPNFSMRFRLSGEAPRFGVSVSKKVSKSAVKRNAIRRRVYSSISKFLEKVPSGLFLFVAKPGSVSLKGEKLNTEIQLLLRDASAIVSGSEKSYNP